MFPLLVLLIAQLSCRLLQARTHSLTASPRLFTSSETTPVMMIAALHRPGGSSSEQLPWNFHRSPTAQILLPSPRYRTDQAAGQRLSRDLNPGSVAVVMAPPPTQARTQSVPRKHSSHARADVSYQIALYVSQSLSLTRCSFLEVRNSIRFVS